MYYVYVLKSLSKDKGYVGMTNNLERRLQEHDSGQNSYTKRYVPWKMIYHEEYVSLEEARKREKYLKGTTGRRYLKKVFSESK